MSASGAKRAVVLVALLSCTAPASSEGLPARSREEAALLFRTLWDDSEVIESTTVRHACEFSKAWLRESIPEELAREELGFELHGAVTGPTDFQPSLPELMSRGALDAASFCSAEDMASHDKQLIDAPSRETLLLIDHQEFSSPVFDARYTKAIVVSQSYSNLYSGVRRNPQQSSVFAIVFAKTKGAWHRTRIVSLGMS